MKTFLRTVYVIWLREVKRFYRERSRILGMIGQPLLYLLVMGNGLSATFRLPVPAPGFTYLEFMYPGIIGMSILFTAMFSSISIVWDREFGFLKEVLVAPVPRAAIAAGKALGGSTTAALQGAILLILAPLVGVKLGLWTVFQVLLIMVLLAFAVTSFGTFIAARMESVESFQMVMSFLIMPLFMLSGAFFPLRSAPAWMQGLMRLDPVLYGVDALRNVILADSPARSFAVQYALGYDLAVLAGVAVVMILLGMQAFARAE
ncbi:MAG: ABC transporter permease [Bacillota bacterium]|nr:ABC transporter permease [Bacillota bacterium]